MKSIEELLTTTDPAFNNIKKWAAETTTKITLLKPNMEKRDSLLLKLQMSLNSTLGAIAYMTGGILINSGWIRLIGSGSDELTRNLISWNEIKEDNSINRLPGALFVGDDVVGGFFAINFGAFKGNMGSIFYFAPDSLEWEDMELSYTEFIHWVFTGDIKSFYETFYWQDYDAELTNVKADECISFYPFLWSDGPELKDRSRKIIPINEIWDLNNSFKNQIS